MRWPALLAIAAVTLLAGCGGSPVAVRKVEVESQPRYTVTVSQPQSAPGEPVEFRIRLVNTTPWTLSMSGCGDEPVKDVVMFDAQNQVVRDTPTPWMGPICDGIHMIAPGEVVEWTREFAGTLYTIEGQPYPAPSGRYTLLSVARYYDGDGAQSVEDAASFEWEAP